MERNDISPTYCGCSSEEKGQNDRFVKVDGTTPTFLRYLEGQGE